jgi:predicted nucleic acid-binding protein
LTTLVDTNVLLDVLLRNNAWADRSAAALEDAIDAGDIAINAVIYAELVPSFDTKEALDLSLADGGVRMLRITTDTAFLAGRAFQQYRQQGGPRTSLLADFFIGAQAAVGGHDILTRDPRRYRTYFPTVEIIEP